MQQPHGESISIIIHSRPVAQKRLYLQKSTMTLNYMSWTILKLKGTTSYPAKSNGIYDVTENGDQDHLKCDAAGGVSIDRTDNLPFP